MGRVGARTAFTMLSPSRCSMRRWGRRGEPSCTARWGPAWRRGMAPRWGPSRPSWLSTSSAPARSRGPCPISSRRPTRPRGARPIQHELTLLLLLGPRLMAAQGYAVAEVGERYTRALTLAQQVGAPQHHGQALQGLARFQLLRAQV